MDGVRQGFRPGRSLQAWERNAGCIPSAMLISSRGI